MRWCHLVSLLVLAAGVLAPPMSPATPTPSVAPTHTIEGVALAVADADRAAEFYTHVLFFEKASGYEVRGPGSRLRVVRMRLGDDLVELVEDPAAGRSPQPLTIVVNDVEQADLWLCRQHVAPVFLARWPDRDPEGGGILTVCFNDPDGNTLALVQFPAGEGPARWQRPTDRVFLGIDRSAIVSSGPAT
jgi:catechol 2,3-dioxygenase-like lactoylglutathione lyase family enzyme